jgi:hypothetical protein
MSAQGGNNLVNNSGYWTGGTPLQTGNPAANYTSAGYMDSGNQNPPSAFAEPGQASGNKNGVNKPYQVPQPAPAANNKNDPSGGSSTGSSDGATAYGYY